MRKRKKRKMIKKMIGKRKTPRKRVLKGKVSQK